MKQKSVTGKVLKCFYNVYNKLGYGFLEKVYEKSLLVELRKHGLMCEGQMPISVFYDDVQVGEYYADILVNRSVILELKAASTLLEEHQCQLMNYLKATEIEVGLLLNFGPKPSFKRIVFSNDQRRSAESASSAFH